MNKEHKVGLEDPKNDLQELLSQLMSVSRLAEADKQVFAKNLGEMAARLSPNNHVEGARQIVMKAGNQNLWPTKRKRYFRLPGEDVSTTCKNGQYASSPSQFRKLAEAAGELLCRSSRLDIIEQWRMSHVKALVRGSTFMPTYVPTGIAEQSAKGLLDEYAAVVSQAVCERTRIQDLWDVLEETGFGPIPAADLDGEEIDQVRYGGAEICPESIVKSQFPYRRVGSAVFVPMLNTSWAFPSINIGAISIEAGHVPMIKIPDDKRHLFKLQQVRDAALSAEAHAWMTSVGFIFNDEHGDSYFPERDDPNNSSLWIEIDFEVVLPVYLNITKNSLGEVGMSVSFKEVHDISFGRAPWPWEKNEKIIRMINNRQLRHSIDLSVAPFSQFSRDICLVYEDLIDVDKEIEQLPIGILPSGWDLEYGNEWLEDLYLWDDPSALSFIHKLELEAVSGWTDTSNIAETLLTEKCRFYSMMPDSEPVPSILPEGSIGASLLQNALQASSQHKYSTLLTNKADEIAKAGLRYYEAMLNHYRTAIHRI